MSQLTLAANKTAVGPGPWRKVRNNTLLPHTYQVTITGVATVSIEGSADGVNPVVLMGGITASAGFSDSDPWEYVRENVTSYTSGTVTVVQGDRV